MSIAPVSTRKVPLPAPGPVRRIPNGDDRAQESHDLILPSPGFCLRQEYDGGGRHVQSGSNLPYARPSLRELFQSVNHPLVGIGDEESAGALPPPVEGVDSIRQLILPAPDLLGVFTLAVVVMIEDRGAPAVAQSQGLAQWQPFPVFPAGVPELVVGIQAVVGVGEHDVAGRQPALDSIEPLAPPFFPLGVGTGAEAQHLAGEYGGTRQQARFFDRSDAPVSAVNNLSHAVEQLRIEAPPFVRFAEILNESTVVVVPFVRVQIPGNAKLAAIAQRAEQAILDEITNVSHVPVLHGGQPS